MASIKEKRKYVMDYISRMYDTLDPSGTNTQHFHQQWDSLSDEEFSKKMESFLNDESIKGFYLEIVEFERDLSLENIFTCAEQMNIPLFEHVALPHINEDPDNAIVTPEPVPVGYIHGKRQQQTLLKKNTGSIHIENRNQKTGQVQGDDKNAVTSNVETYSMVATGSTNALKELLGPRADNTTAKSEMYNAINRDGYVSLNELSNRQEDKVALNTLDEYFLIQGFRTNLVYPPEVIPNGDM
jgi:hypothetical protein